MIVLSLASTTMPLEPVPLVIIVPLLKMVLPPLPRRALIALALTPDVAIVPLLMMVLLLRASMPMPRVPEVEIVPLLVMVLRFLTWTALTLPSAVVIEPPLLMVMTLSSVRELPPFVTVSGPLIVTVCCACAWSAGRANSDAPASSTAGTRRVRATPPRAGRA